MKSIHRQYNIKCFIVHLQISNITLNTPNMSMPIKPSLSLFKHIHTIVKTGNICIFQGLPFVFRKYSRSNRNIQKIP